MGLLPTFVLQPFMCNSKPCHREAQKKVFVFGLGYAGVRIANQLKEAGAPVAGISRSSMSFASVRQHSTVTVSCKGTSPNLLRAFVEYHIRDSTHVLSTVPPDMSRNEDPILAQYADLLLSANSVRWLGYISSTSVYGDHGGALVDEASPILNPSAKGIYGPGRNALQTLLRNPNTLNQTSDTLDMIVSRIHVADLVNAITSAICSASHESQTKTAHPFSEVYNIGDDLPASRRTVFGYAQALLQDLEFTRNAARNGVVPVSNRHNIRASKQISNAKMKNHLLPDLVFPTFREGLNALAQEVEQ